jgi:hypothetical protein
LQTKTTKNTWILIEKQTDRNKFSISLLTTNYPVDACPNDVGWQPNPVDCAPNPKPVPLFAGAFDWPNTLEDDWACCPKLDEPAGVVCPNKDAPVDAGCPNEKAFEVADCPKIAELVAAGCPNTAGAEDAGCPNVEEPVATGCPNADAAVEDFPNKPKPLDSVTAGCPKAETVDVANEPDGNKFVPIVLALLLKGGWPNAGVTTAVAVVVAAPADWPNAGVATAVVVAAAPADWPNAGVATAAVVVAAAPADWPNAGVATAVVVVAAAPADRPNAGAATAAVVEVAAAPADRPKAGVTTAVVVEVAAAPAAGTWPNCVPNGVELVCPKLKVAAVPAAVTSAFVPNVNEALVTAATDAAGATAATEAGENWLVSLIFGVARATEVSTEATDVVATGCWLEANESLLGITGCVEVDDPVALTTDDAVTSLPNNTWVPDAVPAPVAFIISDDETASAAVLLTAVVAASPNKGIPEPKAVALVPELPVNPKPDWSEAAEAATDLTPVSPDPKLKVDGCDLVSVDPAVSTAFLKPANPDPKENDDWDLASVLPTLAIPLTDWAASPSTCSAPDCEARGSLLPSAATDCNLTAPEASPTDACSVSADSPAACELKAEEALEVPPIEEKLTTGLLVSAFCCWVTDTLEVPAASRGAVVTADNGAKLLLAIGLAGFSAVTAFFNKFEATAETRYSFSLPLSAPASSSNIHTHNLHTAEVFSISTSST